MTRKGPAKKVDAQFWQGRLDNARACRDAAQAAADLAEPGQNANPLVSLVVTAAIAYSDALTSRMLREVNQQDHQAAVKTLRAAFGNGLPDAQERRLAWILREKDQAQYSARRGTMTHARELLGELDEFAAWAEVQLARP